MKIRQIRNKQKKLGVIYSFLRANLAGKDNYEDNITELVEEIEKISKTFAGFRNKRELIKHLVFSIFANEKSQERILFDFNERLILRTIEKTICRCARVLPSRQKKIFVFPTFSYFVRDKMFGVTGFTPCRNTFHIFIYPQKIAKEALAKTVAHEFNHSVFMDYHKQDCHTLDTLSKILVFEGMAENFVEDIFGEPNVWSRAVSMNECRKIFLRIKKYLNIKHHKIYFQLFFGGKKYPEWAGYAIAYQVVKRFLRKNKKRAWKEILRRSTKTILKELKEQNFWI